MSTLRKGGRVRLVADLQFGPAYLNAGRELVVCAKRTAGRPGSTFEGRDGLRVRVDVPKYGPTWLYECSRDGTRVWEVA